MPRLLHVTSPLMTGEDVHKIQVTLSKLGYHPGAIDGRYGPSTASAISHLQHDSKIKSDGIVGPTTWAIFLGHATHSLPTKIASAPPHTGAGSPGVKALAWLIPHIGYKESPPGSNRNKFGVEFGVNGAPWCNIFLSLGFLHGAGIILCKGFKGAGVYPKGCTYVPTTEAWLRATGQWIGRAQPQSGDIAIYNWDGGVPDHIGVVEKYLGGGKFQAIEGNTGHSSLSNGGEVMRTQRYITQVDGFGRIHR